MPVNNDLFKPIGETPTQGRNSRSKEELQPFESTVRSELLDQLPSVTLWRSWKSSNVKLPNYLVKGRGKQLDLIANRFVQAIERENMHGVNVVLAGGSPNLPNVNRPLRVISQISKGHFGATDVTFRGEGTDLFVRFQSLPRTLITYLRLSLYAIAFLIIYSMLMALYLFGSGAFDGWATDYAQKHSAEVFAGQDHHVFYKRCITEGYHVFNNNIFVAEMSASGGDVLLVKVIDEELGKTNAGNGLARANDPSGDMDEKGNEQNYEGANALLAFTSDKALQEAGLQYLEKMRMSLLSSMGAYGPAQLALKAMDDQYNQNDYFWWYNPRANFVVMFSDFRGTDSFWFTKNVNFASLFLHDFGDANPELKELSSKMTAAMHKSISVVKPWNAATLFISDPKLAMLSLGGPSTILAMLIGGGLYLLPVSILHWPCRSLGWPTYEEFINSINARNAWVERVLSDMLMNDFGVQEQDRFTVMNQ